MWGNSSSGEVATIVRIRDAAPAALKLAHTAARFRLVRCVL